MIFFRPFRYPALEGNFFFSLGDVSVNGPFGVTENVFVCYHEGGGAVAQPPLNSETIEREEKRERISSRKIERVKRDFLQVSCKRITAIHSFIHSFIKTFFACVIYSKSENGWFQNIKRSFYYHNLQEAALGATQT